MEELSGRVAVITGGASGIGLATARRLAREGMKIVLADIEADPLATAQREVSGLGTDVLAVPTDVGDLEQVRALADRTFEHFGRADLIFNNAGIALNGAIQDMTHADWEWSIRVNLWGVIHGVEVFVPRLIDQGEGGHIVSTASFAGLVPNQGLGVYCVTKYGVVALSECLRRDLSSHGIGVSVLCPMRVETNIKSSRRNRPGFEGQSPPPPDPEREKQMSGGVLKADVVADMVHDAVRANQLYIITHPESRPFIRRRFERIDRSFDAAG